MKSCKHGKWHYVTYDLEMMQIIASLEYREAKKGIVHYYPAISTNALKRFTHVWGLTWYHMP